MRNLIAFTMLLVSSSLVHAQTTRENGAFAIVDVRIEVGDGTVIDKGTIILRDGIIQEIGTKLEIPPDAEIVKGTGLVAYAGFIDAGCTRGSKLPEWQPDQDRAPDTTAFAPASMREANRKWVRPELRSRDYLALPDTVLGPMRRNGFSSALIVPAGGIITGVSTLVNLSGLPRRDCIVRGSVGLHMSFSPSDGSDPGPRTGPSASGTGYPGSLLGIIADLRQTIMDAGRHRLVMAAYERSGGARPPADESLDALLPALDRKMPTIFSADTKVEIDRAQRLAGEFQLQLILSSAGEAWKEGPLLARKRVPILVTLNFGDEPGVPKTGPARVPGSRGAEQTGVPALPTPAKADDPPTQPPATTPPGVDAKEVDDDTPRVIIDEQHKRWEERVSNAAQLEKSGAEFAFITSGLKSPADFWTNLRRAIKGGLSRQAALRALTVNPARILGVDRQMGTLAVGKMANVLLMTADFADPSSKVKVLFIDKNRFEPDAEPVRSPAAPAPVPAEIDEE